MNISEYLRISNEHSKEENKKGNPPINDEYKGELSKRRLSFDEPPGLHKQDPLR